MIKDRSAATASTRAWDLLRPRKSDLWILMLVPIMFAVEESTGSVRALLVGFLVSCAVMIGRHYR